LEKLEGPSRNARWGTWKNFKISLIQRNVGLGLRRIWKSFSRRGEEREKIVVKRGNKCWKR
jgi:hypothetical protein